MYRTVAEICDRTEQEASVGQLAQALDSICDFVAEVISNETSLARVFSSPQLDLTCLKLGSEPSAQDALIRDPDQAVFVATALYATGGHSRVLLDIARADPCRKIHVLVTNLRHDYSVADIHNVFAGIGADSQFTLEVTPGGSSADRLQWLKQRLSELKPVRTYLVQHNYDSVAVAAAQPELVGRLFYIHHCDHSLALGIHIPHATHVDLTAKSYYGCRECEGVNGNVVWRLPAHVPHHRTDKPFLRDGILKTCTSGSIHKFDTSLYRQHIPYSISYPQIVTIILREGGGTHLHIGVLSDPILQAIRAKLGEAEIAPDRFIYIPSVPNLADTLLSEDVDVYVGSFPHGGGRATAEAMGAGIPVVIHANYRSAFLCTVSDVYDGTMIWSTAAELVAHLRELNAENLRAHAEKGRKFFDENYSTHLLQERMKATFKNKRQLAPPRPVYFTDALQTFLDEQWALTLSSQLFHKEIQQLRHELRRSSMDLETANQKLAAEIEHARRMDELLATQKNELEASNQKLAAKMGHTRQTNDLLKRMESANSSLAIQDSHLINALSQSNARVAELQRLTESSRFIFKAAWKKIINTPRDISRRIRRSRKS